MNMIIEEMPTYQIAYIRQIGPYGANNIQTMKKLKDYAQSKNLYNDKSIILGIAQDNPQTTQPEDCRYDTCIVVSNDFQSDEDYIYQGNIAGGTYAVFKIEHTAKEVQSAWSNIFIELSNKNFVTDDTRPIFERYIVEMVNNHFCEICVPIKNQ